MILKEAILTLDSLSRDIPLPLELAWNTDAKELIKLISRKVIVSFSSSMNQSSSLAHITLIIILSHVGCKGAHFLP